MPLDVVCLCRAWPLGTRQNKPFAVCRPFRTRQNKRNRSHLPPHQSKALKWSSPIGLNVLRRIIPLSLPFKAPGRASSSHLSHSLSRPLCFKFSPLLMRTAAMAGARPCWNCNGVIIFVMVTKYCSSVPFLCFKKMLKL